MSLTFFETNLGVPIYKHVDVGQGSERLMGRAAEDLVGKICWDEYADSMDSEVEARLRRAMAERVSIAFESYDSSSRRWFDLRVFPSREGGLSIYFQDITDRKRAEQALLRLNETLEAQVTERTAELRSKETRLRAIFENSYMYQGYMSLDGALLDANSTSLSEINASLEEVVNKPFWKPRGSRVCRECLKL